MVALDSSVFTWIQKEKVNIFEIKYYTFRKIMKNKCKNGKYKETIYGIAQTPLTLRTIHEIDSF